MTTISEFRGDTIPVGVYLTKTTDGSFISLAGYTFTLTIKPRVDNLTDDSLAIAQTSATIVSGTSVTLTLTSGDTNTVTPGDYVYDIQYTTSNTTTTFVKGKFKLKGDVTRTGQV